MSFLDYLFPKRCLGCGCWGSYFCGSCRRGRRIKKIPFPTCLVCGRPAFQGKTHDFCRRQDAPERFVSFLAYRGLTKKAVKKLKYQLVSDLAEELVSLALRSSVTKRNYPFLWQLEEAVLLPIPLHPRREKARGFNQAAVLAKPLADHFGWSVEEGLLLRKRFTPPQATLGRRERLVNVKDCFSLRQGKQALLRGKTVIVFDDVATTGTTLKEAVKVIREAGLRQVWAMSLAG